MAPAKLAVVFLATLAILSLLPAQGSSGSLVVRNPVLTHHNGPLLKGNLSLAILWYGNFGRSHKSVIRKFIRSLNNDGTGLQPRVSTWWRMVESYQGAVLAGRRRASPPPIRVRVAKQTSDKTYSSGNILTQDIIPGLVKQATGGSRSLIAAIFTAKDVSVQGLCTGKCSLHGVVTTGQSQQLYMVVGNPVLECPYDCAWPFHKPKKGAVKSKVLKPPSGKVGADAMVVSLASALAGMVTNPYNTGFFQGHGRNQIEAVTACSKVFGTGAHPGYTGKVAIDGATGRAFNAHGWRAKFLLPGLWNPKTSSCWTLM
ncbi:PREDICTED: protein EXORDIUM-like 2 [Nelumbo nucifera]|nr:PREDICTED: protein EXORDIUM-like 2 [Nelumbo nucifera]